MTDFIAAVIAAWPALVVLAAFVTVGLALDHAMTRRWENQR